MTAPRANGNYAIIYNVDLISYLSTATKNINFMPIPQLRPKSSGSWRDYHKKPAQRPTGKRGPSYYLPSQRKPKKPKNLKGLFRRFLPTILILGTLFLIFAFIYTAWVSRDLPNPNHLIEREVAQSTKIYDRTGEHVLYEVSGDEKRTLISLEDVPDYVKQATIALEDKNFYKHGAFSVWAMFRTAITNVLFRRSAGGSTLTQQFIKNAVLTPEKTISRKVKELVLSYRLEKKFSKDEILQMYLNEIPYGSNAYGVEAASQKYFGKSVKEVSLAEAALLAAIVQRPSYYSPYGSNKDLLLGRKDYVLTLMAEQGYISEEERDFAKEEEINFASPETNIKAPHFVMYIKSLLSEKFGEKTIEQGGLKIYTTLDLYKQEIAEEVIKTRTENYEENFGASNAALVALDPKTGEILAMVGSRDYFNDEIDGQVNVTMRPRQPGSSMKPIVYAALFERGYTPDTILYDVNTNFSTNPSDPYAPKNYGGKEHGPVTIRQALAGSLNLPAVKAIYLADINNVLELTDKLGYTTLYDRSRFGLSLVLGGGEVKMVEHVNAYSAFARDGQINSIAGILKIEDKDGRIIEEYKPEEKKVLDPQVARMINSILSDNSARAFIFGENNPLTLGDRAVAAKTGTTNDYHDAWTVGYTPSLVAGVWVGNNNNDAMKGAADGSILAAPIWRDFMSRVLGDTPKETFRAPDDYQTGKDILDGRMPVETIVFSPELGVIEEKNIPSHHSILYYIDRADPRGPAPSDPSVDPQFSLWEEGIKAWVEKNDPEAILLAANRDPANQPTVKILFPSANQTISSPSIEILAEIQAPRGLSRTEYYLNGNLWETRWGEVSSLIKNVDILANGYHSLRVRACDDQENCGEESVNFNLLIKNNPAGTGKNSISLGGLPSGSAVKEIDFPLSFYLSVEQPEKTARIKLLAENGAEKIIIKNLLGPFSENINSSWTDYPPTGIYDVSAELYGWNGEQIKSNEIKIIAD